jgi:hypothetical protein
MIGTVIPYTYLYNLWGGDLPSIHGEAALFLVSLARYTSVSSAPLAAPPHHQWALDLFTPEGRTVDKFKFKFKCIEPVPSISNWNEPGNRQHFRLLKMVRVQFSIKKDIAGTGLKNGVMTGTCETWFYITQSYVFYFTPQSPKVCFRWRNPYQSRNKFLL